MKVYLLRDVAKVGAKDTIVEVQQGYAHNFLIKNGFARQATKQDEQNLSQKQSEKKAAKEALSQKQHESVKSLDGAEIKVARKANEKGVLFAKIHAADLISIIKEQKEVLVESDWLQAENVYGYNQEDVFGMAAAYAFHLAESQAFIDGNKRTAVMTAFLFLEVNGVRIRFESMRLYPSMILIAKGELDRRGLAEVLRDLQMGK